MRAIETRRSILILLYISIEITFIDTEMFIQMRFERLQHVNLKIDSNFLTVFRNLTRI